MSESEERTERGGDDRGRPEGFTADLLREASATGTPDDPGTPADPQSPGMPRNESLLEHERERE